MDQDKEQGATAAAVDTTTDMLPAGLALSDVRPGVNRSLSFPEKLAAHSSYGYFKVRRTLSHRQTEDFFSLKLPDYYRAVLLKKSKSDCFYFDVRRGVCPKALEILHQAKDIRLPKKEPDQHRRILWVLENCNRFFIDEISTEKGVWLIKGKGKDLTEILISYRDLRKEDKEVQEQYDVCCIWMNQKLAKERMQTPRAQSYLPSPVADEDYSDC